MRTKPFAPLDSRDESGAEHQCVRCGRAVRVDRPARYIRIVNGGDDILHPEDDRLYTDDDADLGCHPVGLCCARRIGLAWTRVMDPIEPPPAVSRDDVPDAECTECGERFWSADGPGFNLAVCRACFQSGSTGPLGVVS